MAVALHVDIVSGRVREALTRLERALPAGGDMSPVFTSIGRLLKTSTQLRFRSQTGPDGRRWTPSLRARTEGGQTLSLTRRLRNSITYEAARDRAVVGTSVLYAAIHHFGGVIRAKAGPFLAIPVTDAARAAGSPRNMQGLATWQTLKGQFVMGDSKSGTVHFLLRHQVTMPSRPFLGASDDDQTNIVRVVQEHLARAALRR